MSWNRAPIGDLCELVNGRAFKPSEWAEEGLKIIRIQNLNSPSKPFNHYDGEVKGKHRVANGDILLSWSGTPGTSFGCFQWQHGNAVLNQHIFKVLVDESRMTPLFFLHAVNSQLTEMIELAHGGVGLRHITKGKLESIEIPTPPLDEQHRIVARIRDAMGRVDEVQRLRDETKVQCTMLFEAGLSSLANPNWPTESLASLAVETRNGWSGKKNADGQLARVLKLSAVHGMVINPGISKDIGLSAKVISTFKLSKDDLFVVRGNGSKHLVGRPAIANESYPDVIFNDLLIRLRPPIGLLPEFLLFALVLPATRKDIEARAKTAAGIWKINQKQLALVRVPIPSISLQREFVNRARALRTAARTLLADVSDEAVGTLSGAVLRKAFAGGL